MFTRQGLFYNTVVNCLKFDVEKGVCTQFIILSENSIRIIIISYKYIMHLNWLIHVYLSLIVGKGKNKLVWSFVSCSLIIELYMCLIHVLYCVNDDHVVKEQNTCNLSSIIMFVLYDYCIHLS